MNPASAHHPFLSAIRRAAAAGRPTEDGLIVAEGPHLVEEAIRGSWIIELIVTTSAGAERFASLLETAKCAAARRRSATELTRSSSGAPDTGSVLRASPDRVPSDSIQVPARTFSQIASTETAQEILCLLRPRAYTWPDLFAPPALVVVLDALQDPGNAGAIVRSAEAFGASGLVFLEGSVRVSNPKFLRAAAGSLFRLPFLERVSTGQAIEQLGLGGLALYALTANASQTLREGNFKQAAALIVGNEGAGVSAQLRRAARQLSIPSGKVESLNAAIACSLALYEAHNQRIVHESL